MGEDRKPLLTRVMNDTICHTASNIYKSIFKLVFNIIIQTTINSHFEPISLISFAFLIINRLLFTMYVY